MSFLSKGKWLGTISGVALYWSFRYETWKSGLDLGTMTLAGTCVFSIVINNNKDLQTRETRSAKIWELKRQVISQIYSLLVLVFYGLCWQEGKQTRLTELFRGNVIQSFSASWNKASLALVQTYNTGCVNFRTAFKINSRQKPKQLKLIPQAETEKKQENEDTEKRIMFINQKASIRGKRILQKSLKLCCNI